MSGKRIGIVIGNNYPNSNKELKFAVADAEKMKEILENKEICGFDEVKYLPNETSLESSSAIEKILKNADNDLIFIYFSGHGKKDFEGNLCLLFNDTKEDALLTTSLTFDFVQKCIKYPSKKTVVIVLDCCYSGVAGIKDGDTNVMGDLKKLSGSGTIILTSTGMTGSPTAREDEKLGHGLFTYFLIEGLEKGSADNNDDGLISINELYDYTSKKTKENSSQSPKMVGEIEGTIQIGKNPSKIREKEYELKMRRLLNEFGDLLPTDVLSVCQSILRSYYKAPSFLEKDDKIILGYLESLLQDNPLPEKRDEIIQNCIEAVQNLKKVSIEKLSEQKEIEDYLNREIEEPLRKKKERGEALIREKTEKKAKVFVGISLFFGICLIALFSFYAIPYLQYVIYHPTTSPVVKETPIIIWNPDAITVGTELSKNQLNATAASNNGNSVSGTFAYNPPGGTVLNAGSYTLNVDFTPYDTANYSNASKAVGINVQKMTPTITWNKPYDITYGTILSSIQLNAVASAPGTLTYNPPTGTILSTGPHSLHVDFKPYDTANYSDVPKEVEIDVNKVIPTITWNKPDDITYGTALNSTQLNAVASVPGTLTYNPPTGTILSTGPHSLHVDFTPYDTANYINRSKDVVLYIKIATPIFIWHPADITIGTELSDNQLNAVASVPGTLTYNPPAGTRLGKGPQTLHVDFTPYDTANYSNRSEDLIINGL
jgi:hypothetical protein